MRCAWQVALVMLGAGLPTATALAQDNPADACTTAGVIGRWLLDGVAEILVLKNDCEQRVVCQVWTSVDPYPRQLVRAAPGRTVEIVMRRGAEQPFSIEVTAGWSCRFE